MPETLHELWAETAVAESRAADYHQALAAALAAQDGRLAALFECAARDEAHCAREAASRAGTIPPVQRRIDAPTAEDGLRLLEESFERYSDITERAKDESVMREAQDLAARAVRRLSLVCGSVIDTAFGV